MSFCKECTTVVTHEGTPTGKIEKINGIDTYVAVPSIDYPKHAAILFLPDIFGVQLVNAKLLADDYAKNGFQTYIPDYLNGDPCPAEGSFDINAWFPNHGADKTRPPLDAVIKGLQTKGVTHFGAIGFCLGGRYVFDLAFENAISAAVVNHPSLLKSPDDLQKYSESSKVPLLINSCETDQMFPKEAQEKADEILGDGKFTPGYRRAYWPGCTHGFSVRGDMSDPKVKGGKEGAFKESVEWFIKHL